MNSNFPRHAKLHQRRQLASLAATVLLLGACANSGPTVSPTLSKERIAEILASPDRRETDRTNDIRRKPADMLAFIGVRPGMVALDVVAGGGYTTELLARAVGPTGRVYGQSAPRNPTPPPVPLATPEGNSHPNLAAAPVTPAPAPTTAPAPRPTSAQMLADRAKNAALTNIIAVEQKYDNPVPNAVAANTLDLVTLMFNYHDLVYQPINREQMNKAIFNALKSGGLYVIADHAGRAGTGISEANTLHRMEEAFLRKEIEAAGFKLAEEGNFLRNPADPRDKNTPNPPMPKDEFVLKFVKP